MSDPVTNAEVEDVLSSIRRLVSEDKRPMQAPRRREPSDRLVLTPALRVMEADAEPTAELDEDISDKEVRRPPSPSLESLVTDDVPVDVYGDAEQENILDFAEDEGDPVSDAASIEDDYSDDPYSFDEDAGATDAQDDAHELNSFTKIVEDSTKHEDVQTAEEIGEDWNEDDRSADDVDALHLLVKDAVEEDHQSEDPAEGAEDSIELMQIPGDAEAPNEPETGSAAVKEAEDPPQEQKTVSLSTKIAALETAIGKIAGTWEPDDPGDSAYAGTEPETMEWEDDEPATEEDETPAFAHRYGLTIDDDPQDSVVETSIEDETEEKLNTTDGQPEQVAIEEPMGLDLSSDEQIIDEEMLRDLVGEIVRAELQGALGERITRNVRKLVRREIHRALTAQELE